MRGWWRAKRKSKSTADSTPRKEDEGASSSSSVAAAAGSSVSSSGWEVDTADRGFCRHSDPVDAPRNRHSASDLQRYRRMNGFGPSYCGTNTYAHCQTSTEAMSSTRATSSSSNSKGHLFRSALVQPRTFYEDAKSSFHPLPLPPSSSASSSYSLQSQWKKGKLLGRGTFGHVYLGFNCVGGHMCAIKEVKVISDDSKSKECLKQLNQKGKLLGRGTFGHVYLGFNCVGGHMCAIKEVKVISDDSKSKECLKQLNQEITLLSQLSHPNIMQYFGSELVDDTLSVYFEYVSGGSIHKLLQEYGPFSEIVIRNYTFQILSGLAYLHGRNTVHRDIKGANILVGPNGEIKLADFGMAKHITSYTSIHSFKGSPYWMAPEVIMNSNGYNLSVDIWSLGCTLLEMATSKPPWSQYEGVAAIFKIGNSKVIPPIPDQFSAEGKSFLKLCLERDPAARPTAAQLLEHPFVRDQSMAKTGNLNIAIDMVPPSDGRTITATTQFSTNKSLTLQARDVGMRDTSKFPSASSSTCKNTNDPIFIRTNMSLPVSPCSSPLRQFGRSNRSCLPSPRHPAYY